MSQSTGGEAVPADAVPSFQPEVIDPFEARKAQFASVAGCALTDREVLIASWFYQAGKFDERQAAPAAAAAGVATSEASPAADSAQTHAGQGGAEQDSTAPETLDEKLQRCPIQLTVTEGAGTPATRSFSFANAGGENMGDEVAAPDELVIELGAVAEKRGLRTVARPREVVAFTLIPPEQDAAYTAGVPADLRTSGQESYLVEYVGSAVPTVSGRPMGQVDVYTTMVLPRPLAIEFSQALDSDPRAARKVTDRFIESQLGQLPRQRASQDTIRTQAEVDADQARDELGDAAVRVELVNEVFDGQPTLELVKVMNAVDIDPNGQAYEGYRYGYRVIPMPRVERPAPAAANSPAPRRNRLPDLPGLPRRRQS